MNIQRENYKTKDLQPADWTLTSDWSINNFIMVVYEKKISVTSDRKFWPNLKNYDIIYGSVRTKCSSCTVINVFLYLSAVVDPGFPR